MNILAVDAASDRLSVAIGSIEARVVSRAHDEALLPLVGRLFRRTGLEWKKIDAIAVAVGPGRFTGIRIGMAFAAAAGFWRKIPIVAVSRLEAVAWGQQNVLAALPGWKGEIYAQEFSRGRAKSEPSWLESSQWAEIQARAHDRGLTVVCRQTGAKDLLAVAKAKLKKGARTSFKPLYVKPAGYERAR